MLVHLGDADGMICGMIDTFHTHLKFIEQVLGRAKGAEHSRR
jgi:malate dehydrogenase (oxaloacetate-decarboxylating)(NADP+)